MTARVMERMETATAGRDLSGLTGEWTGVYHAAGAGETTWHGFASEAVRLEGERRPELKLAAIDAITTAAYPTAAQRPLNSRLNCGKLSERFGWTMMDWRESLREVMAEI
jgi:dTDP-4-dehydrorhamnose reductase